MLSIDNSRLRDTKCINKLRARASAKAARTSIGAKCVRTMSPRDEIADPSQPQQEEVQPGFLSAPRDVGKGQSGQVGTLSQGDSSVHQATSAFQTRGGPLVDQKV